ncbi:MAG: SDR family NAD(P)-dependent oxidoreductase [Pseudomonadota bacterium]
MSKTILITGSTDGIGLEAAKLLAAQGHTLLLHGRNPGKLAAAQETIAAIAGSGTVEIYTADLSRLSNVGTLVDEILQNHDHIDVLINNAGILKTPHTVTEDGLDVRFAVNTLAPYILARRLLPAMDAASRVVNVSSAAQAPVDHQALSGQSRLSDMDAYSQSKLAITMWSRHLAQELGEDGPVVVAVNPGSLLASKMVKQGFGIAGNDIGIGADILARAAVSDEFSGATGHYYDNDAGRFGPPHPHALDAQRSAELVLAIEEILRRLQQ